MFIEYKMEYNTEEIINIDKIQFCVYGNDEIKRYSVVNKDPYGINIPETYDSHEPKRGGLIDSRLGTTDYQINCATCGLNSADCPGHFGHTLLTQPVYHFGFIEHVKNILGCVCIKCSKLLVYKNEKEINDLLKNRVGKARFDEIKRLTSNITYCQNPDYSCGAPIPSIRDHETGLLLIAETKVDEGDDGAVISNTGKQKIQEILTATDSYNILKNISDVDCRIMGFDPKINRPENLIIINFPIPPVAIRPSIRRDAIASKSFEDSMTDKLADIIKRNVILRTNLEKSAITNEEFKYNDSHHLNLQYNIATYFDNESSILQKSEQKSGGKLYKSVSERLKGKQGRVRGNLLGKRTNFSGRTVITSNPDIGTDELGVPLKLAMILTFPEVVTPQNIGKLTKLVKNGRDNYPGANYVYPKGNNKRPIDLRYRKKNIKLHYGDIIDRHLIDGDYVLYNRQPSLHKLSMMGHRCVILRDPELTTFGMNVSVTTPYNADYDGDEMNIFVPQSIQASIELELIANVRNQIIAPASSGIKISVKQDAPLGVYLLTRENMDMDSHHASNIVTKNRNVEHDLEKSDKSISKSFDIFSSLLPKKLNIVQYDDKGDKKLEILNGKLLKGTLTSKIVNQTILSTILDQYGNDVALDYIDNLQKIMLQFLLSHGSTIGLKDIIIGKESLQKCKDVMKAKRLEVECMITEIENNPDLIDPDTIEKNMTSILQSVSGDITKITMNDLEKNDKNNNLLILVSSGAKGKPDNVSGMAAGKGQMNLNFARIKKKVNNRTFAHFFQNDDRPEARGYAESSYFDGLQPIEFFIDAMAGREGLIDTAIRTADSGYINRRLIKCMEDVVVHYDGTIRNGNNIIVQYIYGDSHLDQVKQKLTQMKTLKMNNEKLNEKYRFNEKEIEELVSKFKLNKTDIVNLNENFMDELVGFRNLLRKNYRKATIDYRILDDMYFMPVSFSRIIDNARYGIDSNMNDLDPMYIMDAIENVLSQKSTKLMCMSEEERNNDLSLKVMMEKKHKSLFRYGLLEYLAPKRCLNEYKFDKTKFNMVIKEIINSFNKCLVESGEMVGCVGGQSIGEQTTQMTLNTKHSSGAGVAGMQGIPRLNEILRKTENIKTPIMYIYMKEGKTEDKELAYTIGAYLKETTLKDIVKKVDIVFDSDLEDNFMKDDKVNIKGAMNLYGNFNVKPENLPWLFRFEVSKEALFEKKLVMLEIKSKFINWWDEISNDKSMHKNHKELIKKIINGCIMTTSDNANKLYIHIRFDISEFNNNILLDIQNMILYFFQLKGIAYINDVSEIAMKLFLKFNEETGDIDNKQEYIISTDGINMNKLRYIKYIDNNRAYCNEINTICKLYGIEAARQALVTEINKVFSGDLKLNYNHLSILCDVMTNTGELVSIDRHGFGRMDTDPLAKASFERTVEMFINSAVYGEVDKLQSVSSRLIMGRAIRCGTGFPEILMDTDILENTEYNEVDLTSKIKDSIDTLKFTENVLIDDFIERAMNGEEANTFMV
jgi:DNA-directed RNA polymerase II subunit RPB1